MNHRITRALTSAALAAGLLTSAAFAADKPAELLKPAGNPSAAPAKPAGPSPMKWTRYKLTDKFHSEGAAVGDFNKDGKMDVVAGPYWYDGADFAAAKRHQYYAYTDKDGKAVEPQPFDPIKYSDNFFAFVYDFNADGWDDIMIYGFPGKDASWFENPKDPKSDKPWKRHIAIDMVDNESPTLLDVTGDGKPEIVCNSEGTHKEGGTLGYATADWSNPTAKWTWHAISPRNKGYQRFTHGLDGWTSWKKAAGGNNPPTRRAIRSGSCTRCRWATEARRCTSTTSTATARTTSSRRSPPTASAWSGTSRNRRTSSSRT